MTAHRRPARNKRSTARPAPDPSNEPGDIDPATVETVEVWCKRFDSTFVSAPVG